MIKKVKNTVPGYMLLAILMVKKLLERFTKKNCKNQIKKGLKFKKQSKKKVIKYMLNGKGTLILLTVGLINKT